MKFERVLTSAGLLVAGGLLPLAFAPYGWWPVAIATVAALFMACARVGAKQAALYGWLFGLGMFAVGVGWINESFQYNNVHGPIVWVLTTIFVAFLALFPALGCALGVRISPASSVARSAVALPAAWLLLEWIRGWLLTGFTWLQLGYTQSDAPLAPLLPLFGSYAAGALLALTAGAACALVCLRTKGAVIAGSVVVACWLATLSTASLTWTQPDGAPVKVALVQGNYAQDIKWRPENRLPTLRAYQRYTEAAFAAGADLVVWPETAVPSLRAHVRPYLDNLDTLAEAAGASVLLGLPLRDAGKLRNSVLALGVADGIYHKQHLVPFGEYVPFAPLLLPVLKVLSVPAPRFVPATAGQALIKHGHVTFGITICYESAFGTEVSAALPDANVLVNVSNDAWFGDTLAPHQHLQIARIRVLETRRPMLRATNTGISVLVAADGSIIARSPQFAVHVLEGHVQPTRGMTLYARVGDAPLVALIFVALLVVVVLSRRNA